MRRLTVTLPSLTPAEADRAFDLINQLAAAFWDAYEPELMVSVLHPEPPHTDALHLAGAAADDEDAIPL